MRSTFLLVAAFALSVAALPSGQDGNTDVEINKREPLCLGSQLVCHHDKQIGEWKAEAKSFKDGTDTKALSEAMVKHHQNLKAAAKHGENSPEYKAELAKNKSICGHEDCHKQSTFQVLMNHEMSKESH